MEKLNLRERDIKCIRNLLWCLEGNMLGAEYKDRCKEWLNSLLQNN